MKYTIKDFRKDFPTDAACLAHIFKNRYPKGLDCPKCHKKGFYPVEGRRSYASACGYQVYPTEGTIFHKSPTNLISWFHAIFLMGQSKNGVSAKEIERQLGVTYKCAWRIAKQIRSLMKGGKKPLSGVVEVDETRIGGRTKGQGCKAGAKAIVMGQLQRGGPINLQMVPDTKKETLIPKVQENVAPGSHVMTDSYQGYKKLKKIGYKHDRVRHDRNEFARGHIHTNSIEGFWSQLKRSITGTYHSVSRKHLPSYLDEFSFRYDHRGACVPPILFGQVGRLA